MPQTRSLCNEWFSQNRGQKFALMMIKMIKMKNPPGTYINHMLESDGVKRRGLRARRFERPPIIHAGKFLLVKKTNQSNSYLPKNANRVNFFGASYKLAHILHMTPIFVKKIFFELYVLRLLRKCEKTIKNLLKMVKKSKIPTQQYGYQNRGF